MEVALAKICADLLESRAAPHALRGLGDEVPDVGPPVRRARAPRADVRAIRALVAVAPGRGLREEAPVLGRAPAAAVRAAAGAQLFSDVLARRARRRRRRSRTWRSRTCPPRARRSRGDGGGLWCVVVGCRVPSAAGPCPWGGGDSALLLLQPATDVYACLSDASRSNLKREREPRARPGTAERTPDRFGSGLCHRR